MSTLSLYLRSLLAPLLHPLLTVPRSRVARAVARPGPLGTEQGDFHHSALPLRSLTKPWSRSERRSGVVEADAP
jgi:hypothetical protein